MDGTRRKHCISVTDMCEATWNTSMAQLFGNERPFQSSWLRMRDRVSEGGKGHEVPFCFAFSSMRCRGSGGGEEEAGCGDAAVIMP
jgi:hypothetical protein